MKSLLGGKGAGLAEMSRLGLRVPPGFTISTAVCRHVHTTTTVASPGVLSMASYPAGLQSAVIEALHRVEALTGRAFGGTIQQSTTTTTAATTAPLLLSVRSGAAVSMPGMMDTVLNLGLNDDTVEQLALACGGDKRFAYDSYRRLLSMFGNVVLGMDINLFDVLLTAQKKMHGVTNDADLPAAALLVLVGEYKEVIKKHHPDTPFPNDPYEQLWMCVGAVFKSWNTPRAVQYRALQGIGPDQADGTAVNVQAMVFGNLSAVGGSDGEEKRSATGVAFTRDPATGEAELYGEYLPNAQGEDVVAGVRTPGSLTEKARTRNLNSSSNANNHSSSNILPSMESAMPVLFAELSTVLHSLENHFRDAQDVEFTIERGVLYILQTRSAKRAAAAAVRMAVEMANEGMISRDEALLRVKPSFVTQLLHPQLDSRSNAVRNAVVLAKGLPASPGAACGKVVFKPEDVDENEVLVRVDTSPDDVAGMAKARAVVTARGGMTSHAAVVARGLGTPCVSGVAANASGEKKEDGDDKAEDGGKKKKKRKGGRDVDINVESECMTVTMYGDGDIDKVFIIKKGDFITVDGSSGTVYEGALPLTSAANAFASALSAPTNDTVQANGNGHAAEPHNTKINNNPGVYLRTLLDWADARARLVVLANAETPRDVRRARLFGAKGIGLARSEHMFFLDNDHNTTDQDTNGDKKTPHNEKKRDGDRIIAMRALILSRDKEQRAVAVASLLEWQTADYVDIINAMEGLPVTVRLLDPPLHEFLPALPLAVAPEGEDDKDLGTKEQQRDRMMQEVRDTLRLVVRVLGNKDGEKDKCVDDEEKKIDQLVRRVAGMKEVNPMLGMRGCRVGILHADVYEMQVTALFRAALAAAKANATSSSNGAKPIHVNVMVPLISTESEFVRVKAMIDRIGVSHGICPTSSSHGDTSGKHSVTYAVGTMIELPRAALQAHKIAKHASFFSFGTNDLTQTAFGLSRDDAGELLRQYVADGLLPSDPFVSIDEDGVGELVEIGTKRGKQGNAELHTALCGEQGACPESVRFCHKVGLDAVSCSPFNVPVARLAAARAALMEDN